MSFSGGFVGTIVGSLSNNITPALDGIITNPGSFAVADTLSYAVKDVTQLSLQAGQNYALSQISGALPTSLQTGIAGQITNAAIKAGLNVAGNAFASALPSPITDFLGIGGGGGTGGAAGTTGPSGRQPSLPGLTDSLPPADYGGQSYTLREVVFTIVPYQSAASTATGGQTSPTISLDQAFNGNSVVDFAGSNALKSAVNAAAQFSPVSGQVGNFDFTKTAAGVATSVPAFDTSKLTKDLGTTQSLPLSW